MAVKRVRFCRVTEDGEITTFHLETSSDVVLRPDGTSVEQALQRFANTGSTGGSGSSGATSEEFKALKEQVTQLAVAALKHVDNESIDALKDEFQKKLDGKANIAKPTRFTIKAGEWLTDGTEGYPFYYNIPAAGVTAASQANITIAPGSIDVASAAMICPTCETIAGAVRIRCKNNPTGDITGEYSIQ